jgi:hypothetical protein
MKKFYLILGFITLSLDNYGQTIVPAGNVNGTWTYSGSPYLVKGTIQIPNGSTLIIQPGVIVNFQGSYKLNVQGRLLAIGSITDTITFTVTDTIVGWQGIRFEDTPETNDTSKIIYCKLQYSKVSGGGGALILSNVSKAIISNCLISHCDAFTGGGIYCIYGNPNIINNTITSSTAYYGGGIYCGYNNQSIINNNISNNQAYYIGGGVYCVESNPNIINCIISNNTSDIEGGGIYCVEGNPSIINSTISNNNAIRGGALFCLSNGNPSFTNCILWGNTASGAGDQVYLYDEQSDPNFYFCDIHGSESAFELNGNFYSGHYENNIDADPLFVLPSDSSGNGFNGLAADWSIQNTSPCIDSGDPTMTSQSTDITGNPRVTVCRIDMGAYEYQSGIPLDITLSIAQPIQCNGEATGVITSVVSGGVAPYTYLWSNGQTTANATGLVAGNYSVVVSEASIGCMITKSIIITQPPVFLVSVNDVNVSCGNNAQLNATTNYTGSGILTYIWSPSTGLSADDIANPVATLITSADYSVEVQTPNGCSATDNVHISTSVLDYNPSICMVTVNDSDKNVVVWQRGQNTAIDSFYIYRESSVQTGKYDLIGKLSYTSIGVFTDTTSNARVQSNRYKITVKDICGFVTEKSPEHKTMHLTINKGTGNNWNLIWEQYVGQSVSSYKVYRGTSKTDLAEIGSTSGGNTTYTDETAPNGTVFYQIEVVLPQACSSLKSTSYASSRSNIISSADATSGIASNSITELFIYPNPANDKLYIKNIMSSKSIAFIYDLQGKLVLNKQIDTNPIDISNLIRGIYTVKLVNLENVFINKLIKE